MRGALQHPRKAALKESMLALLEAGNGTLGQHGESLNSISPAFPKHGICKAVCMGEACSQGGQAFSERLLPGRVLLSGGRRREALEEAWGFWGALRGGGRRKAAQKCPKAVPPF